jgi:L-lactate dehydrogenase complex protein LldG
VSDARRAVLAAIRAARAPAAPLPPEEAAAPAGPPRALRDAFARALEGAGGALLDASDGRPLESALASLAVYRSARRVASALPGLAHAGLEPAAPLDPRGLDGLDLAVAPGAFAVAENGAVWVDAGALPERALLWLAEHLVLVVPADAVVADLREAYARLRFQGPGFGVFVAGPSKTADIEQALVIGAQGPRSTTVVLR